jgi:hypothetical protein
MHLFELGLVKPDYEGRQTEKDDNSVMKLSDIRKSSRLTLAHLNRLRIAHDVRKFEHEKKLQSVAKQYKAPAAVPGAGPGGV